MSDATSHAPRVSMRILATSILVGGCLGPYAAGYFIIHHVLTVRGGIVRDCADFANETVYYPVNYCYQRWIYNEGIPYSGRVTGTFTHETAGVGYCDIPGISERQHLSDVRSTIRFTTWDEVKRTTACEPYERAMRLYDSWYQKVQFGGIDPGMPKESIPDFFHATFIITYTHRLRFSWYRSYGEREIELLSIEGRGLSRP